MTMYRSGIIAIRVTDTSDLKAWISKAPVGVQILSVDLDKKVETTEVPETPEKLKWRAINGQW